MIEIRISKILIVISCALLGGLPGLSNVLDYGVNLVNVQHVLSMDVQIVDTFAKSWKAINSPVIHHLAYILIIISEFLVGYSRYLGCYKYVENQTRCSGI